MLPARTTLPFGEPRYHPAWRAPVRTASGTPSLTAAVTGLPRSVLLSGPERRTVLPKLPGDGRIDVVRRVYRALGSPPLPRIGRRPESVRRADSVAGRFSQTLSGRDPSTARVAGWMPVTSSAPLAPSASPVRRVAWASMVGTSLESFDFYVFAYFSAFFIGPLFFEPLGEFGAQLLAFSTIALAFIVRPIGAVIFGHMGDRLGRRTTLLWTVGVMGVATGLIGLLPTYAQAGWVGAVLLVLLRIAQGLSLGGEWGGSILLATEHSGPVKRAFYAAIPQLGSPVGSILSAVLFIVMTSCCPPRSSPRGAGASRSSSPSRCCSSRSTSAGRSTRRRCSRRSSPRTAASACRSSRCSARAPAVVIAIGAALLGIGSYSLMNTYTINYGVDAARLQLPGPARRDDDRRAAAARDHPALRGVGDPHRIGARRRVGRPGHAAHRVPDVLPAAVRDLPDPRRDDDHRRHPARPCRGRRSAV